MTIAMQPIYTQTASGSASSITFNNIPQTFTDLMVVLSGRVPAGDDSYILQFNSDTASNYSWTRLFGTGSSALSDRGTSTSSILGPAVTSASFPANTFSNTAGYVPNYVSNNFKQVVWDGVSEANATAATQMLLAGLWRSTSAITSLRIATFFSGTFTAGSTFSLYGITKG
jgi:hypothetical protein